MDYYKVNHSVFLTEDRLVDSRARLDMLRKIIGGFVQPFPVCQRFFYTLSRKARGQKSINDHNKHKERARISPRTLKGRKR